MRVRLTAAAGVIALLALATASATGAKIAAPQAPASEITVWLMSDAQTNWPEAVAAANQAFRQQHPGVEVNVQYQGWGDYKTKFEATLAAGNAPDVLEFGNTDTPKYSAAGALAPLTKSDFPNSATWLSGLAKAGIYNGRTFAVPYYAGARGVIYRTDQYKAAGIKATPKSLAEFMAAGSKLMAKYGGSKDPTYSAVYYPGRYWHAAMSFVYDYGGQIATQQGGKWVGTLDSPRALAGLTAWRQMVLRLSKANKTGDENKPQQSLVFAKGKVGADHRQRLGVGRRARPEDRQPGPHREDRRVPDAESYAGQVHADVPRRIRARDPGDEQGEDAGGRLDCRLHEHGQHDADGGAGRRDPEHDLARVGSRQEADPGAVRPGRDVELVRALDPELGERRERRRAPVAAQRHPAQPRQDE